MLKDDFKEMNRQIFGNCYCCESTSSCCWSAFNDHLIILKPHWADKIGSDWEGQREAWRRRPLSENTPPSQHGPDSDLSAATPPETFCCLTSKKNKKRTRLAATLWHLCKGKMKFTQRRRNIAKDFFCEFAKIAKFRLAMETLSNTGLKERIVQLH